MNADQKLMNSVETLGRILAGSKKDNGGLWAVLRQHERGFSKTVFDTRCHPIRTIFHEDFVTVPKPEPKPKTKFYGFYKKTWRYLGMYAHESEAGQSYGYDCILDEADFKHMVDSANRTLEATCPST